ncbi:hypothetical protein CRG98_010229 [Punica granatum]|nr:hypothetical protein CRG98_010229 [Punica granatum]
MTPGAGKELQQPAKQETSEGQQHSSDNNLQRRGKEEGQQLGDGSRRERQQLCVLRSKGSSLAAAQLGGGWERAAAQ